MGINSCEVSTAGVGFIGRSCGPDEYLDPPRRKVVFGVVLKKKKKVLLQSSCLIQLDNSVNKPPTPGGVLSVSPPCLDRWMKASVIV